MLRCRAFACPECIHESHGFLILDSSKKEYPLTEIPGIEAALLEIGIDGPVSEGKACELCENRLPELTIVEVLRAPPRHYRCRLYSFKARHSVELWDTLEEPYPDKDIPPTEEVGCAIHPLKHLAQKKIEMIEKELGIPYAPGSWRLRGRGI